MIINGSLEKSFHGFRTDSIHINRLNKFGHFRRLFLVCFLQNVVGFLVCMASN